MLVGHQDSADLCWPITKSRLVGRAQRQSPERLLFAVMTNKQTCAGGSSIFTWRKKPLPGQQQRYDPRAVLICCGRRTKLKSQLQLESQPVSILGNPQSPSQSCFWNSAQTKQTNGHIIDFYHPCACQFFFLMLISIYVIWFSMDMS